MFCNPIHFGTVQPNIWLISNLCQNQATKKSATLYQNSILVEKSIYQIQNAGLLQNHFRKCLIPDARLDVNSDRYGTFNVGNPIINLPFGDGLYNPWNDYIIWWCLTTLGLINYIPTNNVYYILCVILHNIWWGSPWYCAKHLWQPGWIPHLFHLSGSASRWNHRASPTGRDLWFSFFWGLKRVVIETNIEISGPTNSRYSWRKYR